MRVLVACEYSGRVRDAFIRAGHLAMSCDFLPTESPGPHYQGDVRHVIYDGWDLMIAHPTCTYLTSAGLHWNTRGVLVDGRPRAELTEEALEFVRFLLQAPIPRIVLENPVGCIGTRIRKADQTIQPYEFGEDASKATCLWLKGVPPLVKDPAKRFPGRWCLQKNGKTVERWGNQTDSGQNKLAPSDDRWKLRALTYPGIAQAFADNWGGGELILPAEKPAPRVQVQACLFDP